MLAAQQRTNKVLEVEDLKTYFFTREGIVKAVDGISFSLERGELMGLVGESGSGKTVTALSLMRLIPDPPGKITSGKIIFDDKDIVTLTPREVRHLRGNRISMIFQDPMTSLNPVLTIGRQISEVLELHRGLSRKEAREQSIELLELVGIPQASRRVNDYPFQFSGGMRQRVMIAISLSCNPEVLLADEPTTALDVTIQAQILDLLKNLAGELESSVILITHDLGVVARLCQKIMIMYGGYIMESAPTDELFGYPRHPYTWGLLASLPRLDRPRREALTPIKGLPPDLINPPSVCLFWPRCPYQRSVCQEARPPLTEIAPEHLVSCWATVKGGWA